MSYGIAWDDKVQSFILGLTDPDFASSVLDGADRLAAAPTRLSRPSGYPFYSRRQRFTFRADGRLVVLFFVYTQDEQFIYIDDVSIQPPLK